MARKPLTKPRKQASQARSRATVDALVEATTRILVRDGFDKASTNRIADMAGVSIGSLYQYYPSNAAGRRGAHRGSHTLHIRISATDAGLMRRYSGGRFMTAP
jgi:AcrR family transcriptional regulator